MGFEPTVLQFCRLFHWTNSGTTTFGTLPLIRTERTSPFERDDFTNLSSRAFYLVQPLGIEPSSTVLQTVAMTTSAKVALVPPAGVEPTLTNYLLLRDINPLFYH